jgi:hypothetical protein
MSKTGNEPGSKRIERTVAVLRRALDLVGAVVRGVRWLAIVAAGAVFLAWGAAVAQDPPSASADWFARLVVLALLLVPSAVLTVFLLGVRELRELPARFRELPTDVREQARDLGDLRTSARPRRGLIGSVIGLAKLVIGSRDLLTPYAVVAAALRPALLVATALAAIVALLEIPAALLVLIVSTV